jgi:hypothetical protein
MNHDSNPIPGSMDVPSVSTKLPSVDLEVEAAVVDLEVDEEVEGKF